MSTGSVIGPVVLGTISLVSSLVVQRWHSVLRRPTVEGIVEALDGGVVSSTSAFLVKRSDGVRVRVEPKLKTHVELREGDAVDVRGAMHGVVSTIPNAPRAVVRAVRVRDAKAVAAKVSDLATQSELLWAVTVIPQLGYASAYFRSAEIELDFFAGVAFFAGVFVFALVADAWSTWRG